jgi:hypothetical protein
MKLRRTGGRTDARFGGVAVADRVRYGGSVRESAAAATSVWKSPCDQVGDREASSHKKKALGAVAEARLLGTTSPLRSLFERRQYEILPSRYCYTGDCRRRDSRSRPGSTGNYEHDRKGEA